MSTLVLAIGIAVTFLTVWGVVMVGSYLLGDGGVETHATVVTGWVTPTPDLTDDLSG